MSDSVVSVFFVPLTQSGVTAIDVIIFFVILFSSIIIAKIISINVKRRISDKIPISDRETVGKIISMIMKCVILI